MRFFRQTCGPALLSAAVLAVAVTLLSGCGDNKGTGPGAARYAVVVSSAGAGASGGGDYAAGATVGITAGTPPSGYRFKNWTSSSNEVTFADANSPTTTFKMPANAVTVTAVFEAVTYAVTVSNAGAGAAGSGSYAAGATVIITAGTPPDGQRFKNWTSSSDGVTFADANSASTAFKMPANAVAVSAVFETLPSGQYAVTVSSAGKGVLGNGSYAAGETVAIYAGTAPDGQRFMNWTSADGVTFGDAKSATTTFIMPSKSVTATAVFEKSIYSAKVSSAGAGAGGGGDYATGATVAIYAGTPPDGQRFKNWTSTNGVTFGDAYNEATTFVMPSNAVTVTAVFEATYTATVTDGTGGGAYAAGETVTIMVGAEPSGQRFKNWTTASNGVTFADANSATTTFIMPPNAVTVSAAFEDVPAGKYAVTVSSIGTGVIGNDNYAVGETVTIFAGTAPAGQRFKNWKTGSNGVTFANPNSATTTFTMPANKVTVTAEFEQVTYAVIVSSSGTNPSGAGNYAERDKVSISAGTPPAGYKFKNWTTASGGATFFNDANSSTTMFIMPANAVTVTAVFEKATYAVTVLYGGANSSGGGGYTMGETVTISAGTPPAGQRFKNWELSSDGDVIFNKNNSTTTFTMPANDVTVMAVFETMYALTVSSAGTGATGTGNYAAGTTVTISAGTAPAGQKFKNWTMNWATTSGGVTIADANSATTTFTMPANAVTVTANFEPQTVTPTTYAVTVSAGAGAIGSGNYAVGATVTITAGAPMSGGLLVGDRQFKNWTTASSGVVFADANSATTTFIMPAKAVTVTAVFEATYTVTVTSAGTGATGTENYAAGATVSISAGTPPTGQQFKNWTTTSNGVTFGNANSSTTTFTMPTNSVMVTAVFETLQYTVTTNVFPSDGGSVSRSPNQTSYSFGTTVTVTATVASGYTFTGWSGASVSTSPSVTIMIDGDKTLTANFEVITYAVTVTGGTGSGIYAFGATVSITAGTPPAGQQFKNWMMTSDDLTIVTIDVANPNSVATTFTMPASAVTVTAYFIGSNIQLGTLTDVRDNKKYYTVKIGNQTWMAENLNYETGNSWCYDCSKYGRLYDWNTARTVCPTGWRLPDTADWRRLVEAAGGLEVAGKKLKSTSGWYYYDIVGNGTDEYGFSALPGGQHRSDGAFGYIGAVGQWWTATAEDDSDYAYHRYMDHGNESVYEFNDYYDKSTGFSVRCVQD